MNSTQPLNFNDIPRATKSALTPQASQLLWHLCAHGSVTQREALLDLKVQSLTKRVSELRNHFDIVSDNRVHATTGQRYVRYFLKGLREKEAVPA